MGSGQWRCGGHGGGAVVVVGRGGVMIKVKGRWRRKLEKNKNGKNIFYCVDILF